MKLTTQTVKKCIYKYYKKAGAIAVTFSLTIACFASISGERMRESSENGRMIAVSAIESTEFETCELDRITYTEMEAALYDADQLVEIEKQEKNYEEVLLAEKQESKDKAALAALTQQSTSSSGGSTAAVSYTPATSSGDYLGQFVVTAYCPCAKCCGKTNGITASGTQATAGRTIAADTSRYPFGTQLVINGNVYTVEDTGSAIGGNRIDIFFNSHQEAINFGRQVIDVYAY